MIETARGVGVLERTGRNADDSITTSNTSSNESILVIIQQIINIILKYRKLLLPFYLWKLVMTSSPATFEHRDLI